MKAEVHNQSGKPAVIIPPHRHHQCGILELGGLRRPLTPLVRSGDDEMEEPHSLGEEKMSQTSNQQTINTVWASDAFQVVNPPAVRDSFHCAE